MPVLKKGAAWSVEDDQAGRTITYQLTAEGERFLTAVLSLKDGDSFRPKDLLFLVDRGWAVVEEPEPEPEPVEPVITETEPAPAKPAAVEPSRRQDPVRGSVARRTRGREIALQVLYQMEQNSGADPVEIGRFLARRLRDEKLQDFARAVIAGVKEHQPRIDELISGVAENWRIDRMAAIDRNILRIGVYEMIYCPDVPTKVAINEALELAKRTARRNPAGS